MQKRLIFDIDEELHQEFKVECAINKNTMKEVLEEKIKEYIEQSKNKLIINKLKKE